MDSIDVWVEEKWRDWHPAPHVLLTSAPSVAHLKKLLERGVDPNTPSPQQLFGPGSFFLQNCGTEGIKILLEQGRNPNTLWGGENDIGHAIHRRNLAICKTLLPFVDFNVVSYGREGYKPLEQALVQFPAFAYELSQKTDIDFSSSDLQTKVMVTFLKNRVTGPLKGPDKGDFISHQLWKKWGCKEALDMACSGMNEEEKKVIQAILSFAPTKKVKQKPTNPKAFSRPEQPWETNPNYYHGRPEELKRVKFLYHLKNDQGNNLLQWIKEESIDLNKTINHHSSYSLFMEAITTSPQKCHILLPLVDLKKENTNKKTVAMEYVSFLLRGHHDQPTKAQHEMLRSLVNKTGINHQNSQGVTLIMEAVQNLRKIEHYSILDIILSFEPDLEIEDKNGRKLIDIIEQAHSRTINIDYFRSVQSASVKNLLKKALDKTPVPVSAKEEPVSIKKKKM